MVENDESLLERADSMQVSPKATITAVKKVGYCGGEQPATAVPRIVHC